MDKTKTVTRQPTAFLRWAGSKKQHIPFLSTFWSPSFNRYIEPFAGSAVLFFALRPKRAILGDLNTELIQVYRTLRNSPEVVYEKLISFPKGRTEYLRIRELNPRVMTTVERAARFIYLNRYCFNGLYRTNKVGKFNVPYGGNKSGQIPGLDQIRLCVRELNKAQLVAADFRETLMLVKANDFVYLDPPYAVGNRRVFKEYGAKTFGTIDLDCLSQELEKVDRKGAIFVVSYADCREARLIFRRWNTRRVLARRSVSGFLGARGKQYELVATNAFSCP
jgi:DNA adenine methylase